MGQMPRARKYCTSVLVARWYHTAYSAPDGQMVVTAIPAAAADIGSMNAYTIRIYHKVPGMSAVVTYVHVR